MFANIPAKAPSFTIGQLPVPSRQFLSKCYLNGTEKSEEAESRLMMSLRGEILRGDHTFAIAKMPQHQRHQLYEAMYTIMNEDGAIIGYWSTQSKSYVELERSFSKASRIPTISHNLISIGHVTL